VQEKTEKMRQVLTSFKGLNELASLAGPKPNKAIVEIKDSKGMVHSDQRSIAEVFACFYEDLYRSRSQEHQAEPEHVDEHLCIPPITIEELRTALKRMKKGKAKDKAGIVAEMLQADCLELHNLIVDLFTDVLAPQAIPPVEWRETRLVVIYKKGEPQLPSNYRPIALLPILYKLFSCIICTRLQARIVEQQSVDQAAYRSGFSTQDHLICATLLAERCAEFNVDLWLGLVDFEKAFDTVEHDALWKVLNEQGVEPAYINLLRKLYKNQTATVLAGTESRAFTLGRGVKQGDPKVRCYS